ncbi:MAG: hypothetical protein FJ404_15135 [Verrucomicrobia bacterium]|nr:hypothetical protein [Verrucomicrobiota bacterium]
MLPVMQVGRVRPGALPEHDVLHPVGGGLGQARPTNNIGIHGVILHPHFGEHSGVGGAPQRAEGSEDSRLFKVLRLVEGRHSRASGQHENDCERPRRCGARPRRV